MFGREALEAAGQWWSRGRCVPVPEEKAPEETAPGETVPEKTVPEEAE